ncbi:MAG: transcriptional coactivator p15/PC4 family protein [Candidatus Omnitrophota bacterium]|nr:transcriptional coactivator p15/PC4 family protein [Candidatus Omnitrophota bacterium]
MQANESQVIHTFPKSSDEDIQLSLRHYKERLYIDIRIWFQSRDGAGMRPSKKGVHFTVERLADLERGVAELKKRCSELALITPLQNSPNSVK